MRVVVHQDLILVDVVKHDGRVVYTVATIDPATRKLNWIDDYVSNERKENVREFLTILALPYTEV